MKRFLYNILLIMFTLNTLAQERDLLSYFIKLKEDSIINTRKMHVAELCSRFFDNNVPDTLTLKYFFDNDTANMYYEVEDYSPDFNTYKTEVVKKLLCPLFYKKYKNIYLICYDIDHIIYLSFYDSNRDTVLLSYIVSDFTDEYGNEVTHSIIFPNNYIASVEIKYGGDVYYKLLKIDIENKTFILIKNIKIDGKKLNDQEIYKRVYEMLGINEKGELINR